MDESNAPLAIDIDMAKRTLWIEGVEISFGVLKILARPDPAAVYRFRRTGDVVIIERADTRGGVQ
jgi:hypothetical protein